MENKFSWEDLRAFLKGKLFLIGLTFITEEEVVVEKFQVHGSVEELTDAGIFRIRKNDGNIFQIPYDPKSIERAIKAEYREQSTGKIISNPDYIMQWEIVVKEGDSFEKVKAQGFVSPAQNLN